MEQWLIPIISSVLGGLVGGLFTYLGVRATIKHDIEQKRKEELKRKYDDRPRLEITSFKDLKAVSSRGKFDCDFLLTKYTNVSLETNNLFFSYDKRILDIKNMQCVEYTFTNTGKTEIDDVCFVCNQKEILALIELKNIDFYLSHGLPEREAWPKDHKTIKPGESITVRVCYLKDFIVPSFPTAVVSIHMIDIYGTNWRQPLFCPLSQTDNSRMESYRDYKEARDIESVLKYLRDMLRKKISRI